MYKNENMKYNKTQKTNEIKGTSSHEALEISAQHFFF